MARIPIIRPGKAVRIGSDPASLILLDRLLACGALEVLRQETNEHGTLTADVHVEQVPDPKEPLGYWHEVRFRDGAFKPRGP